MLLGSLGQSGDAPNQQAEGWEDRPSEDEDQPPEVRDQGEQGDQTDGHRDEHGEARADLGPRTHLLYVQAEEVLRIHLPWWPLRRDSRSRAGLFSTGLPRLSIYQQPPGWTTPEGTKRGREGQARKC